MFFFTDFIDSAKTDINWIKNKTWGGNVKIKLEICDLTISDAPNRPFKIHVT